MALSAAATSSCSSSQTWVSSRGVFPSPSTNAQQKAMGPVHTRLGSRCSRSSLHSSVRAAAHDATFTAASRLADGTVPSGATGWDVRVAALRRALKADSPPMRPAFVSKFKRTSAGLTDSDDQKQVVDILSTGPNTDADWNQALDYYSAHFCGGYCDYQI